MKHASAILVLCLASITAPAAVEAPRVVCERWPSAYSIEEFSRDVIRLEGAKTDEAKVLALFTWNQRVMRHGYGYVEGPSPAELLRTSALTTADQWRYAVIDPVKILNVYGEGWCDTRSRLFHALCVGAGLKSETVSVYDPKVRVWYADADGQARWHFFDPFRSWWVKTRDGTRIASYEDMVADPTLLTEPSQTSIPYGYTTVSNHTDMFQADGSIFPMLPHTSFKLLPRDYHSMDVRLPKGTRYLLRWGATGKYYGVYELFGEYHRCTNGPHSHIFAGPGTEHTTFADGTEAVIDPVNWPYVRNYYKPCDNAACPFFGKSVKWYGNGTLTYEPRLDRLDDFRDGLYSWGAYRNIAVGPRQGVPGPKVGVDRAGHDAWLLFRVDSPYVIADATIEARFATAEPGDRCAISLSADRGDTWETVWESSTVGETNVVANIGLARWRTNAVSAVSQYGYLVRIELQADSAGTGLDWLKMTSDLELNMFTLPMLQPGANRIRVSAQAREPGDALRVEYAWDEREGGARTDARVIRGLEQNYTIRTRAKAPDDITMRHLLIENVP